LKEQESVSYEDIRYEVRRAAAWITINRPQVMNALRWQTAAEMRAAVAEATADKAVRAIVLTGEGRAFCSGDDVNEIFQDPGFGARYDELMRDRDRGGWHPEGEGWVDCPKPTIAAVNGVAVGSGMDIALQCDIRIASENARFGSYFVRMGLVGTGYGLYFLPRIVGLSRAYELLYTGRLIDSKEADRIGLVSRIVPHDELGSAVDALVSEIELGGPLAQAAIKRSVQRSYADWRAIDEYAMWQNRALFGSKDHKEALTAFSEKRAPRFGGH
jgi:2-(1,2-epoxy-1,2-dihydrophenyl)acetyl-CoA isomerase